MKELAAVAAIAPLMSSLGLLKQYESGLVIAVSGGVRLMLAPLGKNLNQCLCRM